ncbi:uncharacterized protein [Leptinotarsa decemlineata]|uniref:uncharacterized protein n=1 Tax=Leptinotarsa decemlineata TaxID=7539 RepID=UPI003D30A417
MLSSLCFLFFIACTCYPVAGDLEGYFGGHGPPFGGLGSHFGGRPGFGGYKLIHEGVGFGQHFGGVGPSHISPAFSHGFGGAELHGGSEIGHNSFRGGSKALNGGNFHKLHGVSSGEVNHDDLGHFKGEGAFKDVKGESAHFYDADGGKNAHHDGKNYYEGKHFGNEGKTGAEKSAKQGHRKGHTVKGFSTSHHKDESEKTEEFFDEAHDEGGNAAFHGQSGKFGETGASSSKGEHLDGKFKAGESKKGFHFDKESVNGKVHGNQRQFGGKKFNNHGSALGEHKVLDEDDVEAHHESSKLFEHRPSFY